MKYNKILHLLTCSLVIPVLLINNFYVYSNDDDNTDNIHSIGSSSTMSFPKITTSPSELAEPDISDACSSSTTPIDTIPVKQSTEKFSKKKIKVQLNSPSPISDDNNEFSIQLTVTNTNNRPDDKFNIDVIFEDNSCLSLVEEFNQMHDIYLHDVSIFNIPIKINKIFQSKEETIKIIITRNVRSKRTPDKTQQVKTLSKEIFITHADKKAIIIVPGIVGSEIFSASAQTINSKQYSKGYRIWPPEEISPFISKQSDDSEEYFVSPKDELVIKQNSTEQFDEPNLSIRDAMNLDVFRIVEDLRNLSCNEDGSSKLKTMNSYPFDCRKDGTTRFYGSIDTYVKISESLLENENLNDYDIIFFSYDWRNSNSISASELAKFIDEHYYSNVVLIGHSMGGLVCTSYLSHEENKNKVDKFISLGTPFLGANKAINVLETGKFFDGFIGAIISPVANPVVKNLIKNCPSAYELCPPKQCFEFCTDSIFETLDISYKFCCCGKYEKHTPIHSFDKYVSLLLKRCWTPNEPIFLSNAQIFHNSLYKNDVDSILLDDDVNLYNIVGCNTNTAGITQIIHNIDEGADIGELQTLNSLNGDGTITLSSATLANKLSAKPCYYANKVCHLDLVKNDSIIKLVNNIIENEPEMFNVKVISQQP